MTITGLNSSRTYTEDQIFNGAAYAQMKAEPLSNEEGALVVPVRNKKRPHFRRIGDATFRNRIGATEVDPTHKRVVSWLKKNLQANRLRIVTWVFDDTESQESSNQIEHEEQESSNQIGHEEQVIFFSSKATQYRWFSENECRVAFEGGGYIVPDIAGRDLAAFSPSAGHETVIVEVIQTHYPDQDTFFRLLALSSVGHLVIFYFVAPEKWTSKFNRCDIKNGVIDLRPAYYLAQGRVFKNGREWNRCKNQSNERWYSYLKSNYFKHAMENK